MKIAILGATGFVGKVLVAKAIEAGYQVRALARRPEKLGELRDKVEVVVGDYFNTSDVRSSIEGTETVLSAIGAPSKDPPANDLYLDAMRGLIAAMRELEIKRLIIIGGAATPNSDREKLNLNQKILRFLVNTMGRHLIEIKRGECEILTASDLNWTIVRPPAIVPGRASKKLTVREKGLHWLNVPVESLTEFVVGQIASREWIRKTPVVSR
jgi:putative NADH-flavin reductase